MGEENRTQIVKDNLNPRWDEKFTIVVNGSYGDIYLQIFDYDPKRVVSDHLGYASLDLLSLCDEKLHDVWIPLEQNKTLTGVAEKDAVSGSVHVKFRYTQEGNEEKRKAEEEKEKAEEEAKKAEEEAKKAEELLQKAKEEARAEAQKEAEEKQKKAEEARQKAIEAAKKAEEEAQKAREAAQKRAEEEKKRAEAILKEKEEAEKKLEEAMKQLEEAKRLMKEKERSQQELQKKIIDEKEKQRKEKEEELKKLNNKINISKPPPIAIVDVQVKTKELGKPEHLFADNISQIAAGGGKKMYALDGSGRVCMINSSGQKTRIPGILSTISASEDGTVMGTDRNSCIWQWLGANWQQIGGRLYQISVGTKNEIWGISPGDSVWKYELQARRWRRMPGYLRFVSVGEDGEVWGINRKGDCLRWTAGSWRNSNLSNAQMVTVGSKNSVWALANGGKLYQFQGDKWNDYSEWGSFKYAEVTDNCLYAIDNNNNVKTSLLTNSSKPMLSAPAIPNNIVGGKLRYVACSSTTIWGIDEENKIWRRKPDEKRWFSVPGQLKNIDVGADGETWGVNKFKQIFRWNPFTNQWVHCAGIAEDIAVASSKQIYAVGNKHSLWRFYGGRWQRLPGSAKQLSAGFDGELWARNKHKNLYRWQGNKWQRVNAPKANWIAVGSSKFVIIEVSKDKSWQYYDGVSWHEIPELKDKKIKVLSVTKDGVVWIVDKHHKVFTSADI